MDEPMYGVVVFNDRPVSGQVRRGDSIVIKFHDGGTLAVSEKAWLENKRFVKVPKRLGSRNVVTKDWNRYKSQCVYS